MKAVITGASKGIGRAVALFLAGKGFDLAVCARDEQNLERLKDDIIKLNSKSDVFIFPCDVSNKEQIKKFGEFANDTLGNIDILINNAGVFLPGNIHEEEDGVLEKLIETNLYSAYYLTKIIIPAMIKKRKGHVFNMCSVASLKAYENGGSYSISKYALSGFSKNLREELKQHNIRVTTIFPGAVYTDAWKGYNLPVERFVKDEDIAKLVYNAYEISDSAVVEEIVVRPLAGDL